MAESLREEGPLPWPVRSRPRTIRRAQKVHPIAALQTEYSLWSRDPEGELLDTVRELGIGFVAYSPLGRGFLTAKITSLNDLADNDWRRSMSRFEQENFRRNMELVDRISGLAARRGCTPAQLALALVLAQGDDIVPISRNKAMSIFGGEYRRARCSPFPKELAQDRRPSCLRERPPGPAIRKGECGPSADE